MYWIRATTTIIIISINIFKILIECTIRRSRRSIRWQFWLQDRRSRGDFSQH